jgi:hypothetical protein
MKTLNFTQSGILKEGPGKLAKIIINSHTVGTLKLIDGTESGVAAVGTLTSGGACAPAKYAESTLTSDATNVTDGDTVTIGTTVYRFKDTMLAAYDVKIGASAAVTLDNLKAAINATGTAGTEYFAGTLVHPTVIASVNTDTTQKIVARVIGTAANTTATTETSSHLSWADTTLGGGTGTSVAGVATTAATITIDTITYTAVTSLAETHGLTAIPYQVLWVTSEAVFLDNLKLAINASGAAATDYATGTKVHPTVIATTNTNTTQVVQSKLLGSAGNSIATTETMANYSWGATTLASGAGKTGKLITNTITFSDVAVTGEREIDFGDVDFDTGLYATVGGTAADLTAVYK